MPTYDYKCESCKDIFEFFQNMSDKPLIKCPKCNNNVRRLVSGGSGLIFKGSGFYLTDYAKKKPNEKETKKSDKKNQKKLKKSKETKVKK
jgi:putative FmdB family regulatory protein